MKNQTMKAMNRKILVIGSSNTDMTVQASRLPRPGETVLGGVFTMGAGGKGANQAVAAKRLGGDAAFICKVGRDIFGDNSICQYDAEGLDTSLVLRSEKPSGVALISVDKDAENCIVVASGANADLSAADIDNCSDAIRGAGILLMQLEIPVPSVLRAAETAHEAGVMTVLNPAPALELPAEIFRCISLFIPNETELSMYSGMPVTDERSAAVAARTMMEKGVERLIVTMGSKGALIVDADGCIGIPAFKVDAVDTTAAGDTFCGALCVALSEGKGVVEAARFASAASALAVRKVGAQNSIPSREEVESFLDNQ